MVISRSSTSSSANAQPRRSQTRRRISRCIRLTMKDHWLLACCLVVVFCGQLTEAMGSSSEEQTSTEQTVTTVAANSGCPDGFRPFESSCYRLVSDSKINGTAARSACLAEAADSHLVFIQSQAEQTYLQKLAVEAEVNTDFWIGLTYTSDVGHPHWLDGSQLGNFTAWDTYGAFDENVPCVRLRQSSNFLWNDRKCSSEFGYICEIERNEDSEPLSTPAPKPAPSPKTQSAIFQASLSNMAAPMGNHLLQSLKASSLFRCATFCLKHGECASFNYQRLTGPAWEKLLSVCELYAKQFADNELTERSGYRHYRM